MRRAHRNILIAVVLAGAATSCGKKEEAVQAAPELPPETSAAIETQFLPSTNRQAGAIQDRLEGAVHPALTGQLRLFIDTYKRMPENFYEFSNRMMDSVPPVPPGMKYEIDPGYQTVKVVKK